jgi:hypothetical protein
MEDLAHPPGIFLAGQEFVHELFPFGRISIRKEGTGFVDAGNASGKVQVDTAEEFGIGSARRQRPIRFGADQNINALVESFLTFHSRREKCRNDYQIDCKRWGDLQHGGNLT